MVSTAVSSVLQHPGHDFIVERILADLDWRSILNAGMVSTLAASPGGTFHKTSSATHNGRNLLHRR